MITYPTDKLQKVVLGGGCEQRNLPSGFTQVEYIKGGANSYIDTGYKANLSTKAVIEFAVDHTQETGNTGIFGDRVNDNNKVFYIATKMGTTLYAQFDDVARQVVAEPSYTPNQKYTSTLSKDGWYLGSTLCATFNGATSFETENNLTLFKVGTRLSGGGVSIYKLTLYENNIIVHNYIPCKNSSNVLGYYDTVTGNFLINSGTGTFTAGADVVPTPYNPIDIVCNNGVVKARHQSGLPLGYTKVEYISGAGNAAIINTGVSGENDALRIDVKCYTQSFAAYAAFFGNYVNEDTNVTRLISASNLSDGMIPDLNRVAGGTNRNNTVKFTDLHEYSVYQDNNKSTILEVDGTIVDTISYSNGATNTTNIAVNASKVDTTTAVGPVKYFYYMKIWDGNTLIRNFIPATNGSDVAGMYDTVTDTFFTSIGTGTFTAGDPVSDPVEIYTDGTVETINAHEKNLFDVSNLAYVANKYLNNEGVEQSYEGTNYTKMYIPVTPNTNYTVSGNFDDNKPTRSTGVYYFDKNKNFISRYNLQSILEPYPRTYLIPSNCFYIDFQYDANADANTWQIERGSTATTYEPYYNGGTATAEMLLKVGSYKDVQEVLAGAITRNIGIKVLDGTEDWQNLTGYMNISKLDLVTNSTILPVNSKNIFCTHFQLKTDSFVDGVGVGGSYINFKYDSLFTTLTEWKQFLADQCANGTPVIIVYPLATPITEQVTPQHLVGNSVTQTAGSINNLPIESSTIAELKKRYIGDKEVKKVYIGNNLVYEQ